MTLEELRREIDKIDSQIIGLLAERSRFVTAAGKLKKDQQGVRDPKRVEQVVEKVKVKAVDAGLDPRIAEEVYRTIIGCFVRKELNGFTERAPCSICEAMQSDAAEIWELQKRAFYSQGVLYGDFTLPPLVQTLENLTEDFKTEVFLKAMHEGEIIGSVRGRAEGDTCHISRLIVHPDHHNKGIGKRLINAIEEKFRDVPRYELFTGHKSEKNLALYEKLGYRAYKEKPQSNGVSLICMEKLQGERKIADMDEQERKTIVKDMFNTVSEGYDNKALRFFPKSAENMASLLELQGDEHVLDVACGTGHASFAIARMLPRGRITAVDFSSGMLDQARRKAASLKIGNIDFAERDMQDLRFAENSFDAAICAFGIFFVTDMESQLTHIASMVKPGGRVMISNFQESYFHPLKDLFIDKLTAYGVQNPPQAWKRIANKAGCKELFEKAGLTNIRVEQKNVGYYLESAEQWWDIVWNAGFRRLVAQLSLHDQEKFRQEHLEEIGALRTKGGIWLDVGVLYTTGTKPSEPR